MPRPRSTDVTFPGSTGAELVGTLDLPPAVSLVDGRPRATAVFAHCFTCSRESHAASRISGALAAQGIAVLRFDFTGLGASGGDFAETTFTSNVSDLVAAARWMADEGPGAPHLLVGHSLGGAAVIAAAGRLDDVQAVAVVGAPASPQHLEHLLVDAEPRADGRLDVVIGGRTLQIGRELVEDITDQRQRERITTLRRPLLVLHAPLDEVVGVEQARATFEAARHPKSFIALDGADHLLVRRADSEFAAAMIATWAARYLPALAAAREDDTRPEEGTVEVTELDPAGFTHRAATPRHSWVMDEPPSVGGTDAGPNPYDSLLSALGACTSMTMRMYARRKGWEYGATTVTLTHERVHARDCEACETASGQVDHLHRVIDLDPALTTEQREALLVIADKCPVHRTLTHEVVITTELSTSELGAAES